MAKKKVEKVELPASALTQVLQFLRGFAAAVKSDAAAAHTAAHFRSDGVVRACSSTTGAVVRTSWQIGDFAVPVERFAAAVSAVEAQNVDAVEVQLAAGSLSWRGGSARGRIALIAEPLENAPDAPAEADRAAVTDAWRVAFARAAITVSRGGESWPMLRGAYWAADGALMTSDGNRMTIVASDAPHPAGVMVPDHLLRAMRGFAPTASSSRDGEVWFHDTSADVFGRLYQVEFPHVRQREIFEDFSRRAAGGELTRFVPRDGQPVAALLRGIVAASEPPLHAARVAVGKSGFEVSCERDGGDACVTIAADVSGSAAEFRINAQYLLDAVDQGCPIYVDTQRAIYATTDDRRFQHAAMLFAQ